MRAISSTVVGFVFLAYFLCGVAVAILTAFSVPPEVLPQFSATWKADTIVARLIELMPVATVCGLIVAWSFVIRQSTLVKALGKDRQFRQVVQSGVVTSLFLAIVYALLMAFVYGTAQDQVAKSLSDSDLARNYVEMAENLAKAGDNDKALQEARKSLALAPEYPPAMKVRDEVLAKLREGREDTIKKRDDKAKQDAAATPAPANFARLVAEVDAKLAVGDQFGALAAAEAADAIANPTEHLVAIRKLDEVHQAIKGAEIKIEDRAKAEIFNLKQAAILDQFNKGDFVQAFYTLKQLEAKAPHDPDLREWMPKVMEKLQAMAFFHEEIEDSLGRASGHPLMVRVTDQAAAKTSILYADRVLRGQFAIYLEGFELLELGADKRVLLHVAAPYAKLVPTPIVQGKASETMPFQILTRSVFRERQSESSRAKFIKGEPDAISREIFPLALRAEDLWTVARVGTQFQTAGLDDLMNFLDLFPKFGYDPRPVQSELLDRLTKVLSFVAAGLLAIGIAWSNRNRNLKRPFILGILAIAIIPISVIALFKGWELLCHHINTGLLILGGFGLALVGVVIVQGFLMASAFLIASTQKLD